ncbi:MAG: hypothetical protein LBP31_00135 [Holosporales bacterium]|jgi:hypothetical protein|nr:hypothetical protein [Holosporales bacterium]
MKTHRFTKKATLLESNTIRSLEATEMAKFSPVIKVRASVKINDIGKYDVTVRNLKPEKNITAIEIDGEAHEVIFQKNTEDGRFVKYTVEKDE